MRFCILFTFAVLLPAQSPPDRVPVPAGTTRRIVLEIAQEPVPEDAIYFSISSKRLIVVLVTPDGTRITERTALNAGFDWSSIDVTPPIGSTDAGAIGSMHFQRAGRAGTYAVEFTAPAGVHNAMASAGFRTDQQEYSSAMGVIKGFQKVGPFQLTPGQNPLEIVLDQDEQGAIFDLLTPGRGQFTLTLPDGQTIDSSVGKQGRIAWITAPRDRIDRPGAMFGISGFLLPDAGMHHVVIFQNAAKGRYRVHAVGGPAAVTAAFIPLGRTMEEANRASTAPPQVPAGEIRIQPYALPNEAKVGDNVTATVGIAGEPLSDLRFVAHMEYRQILARDPLRYSEPMVEALPTVFTRNSQGLYQGKIVPRRPGVLRVGVQVSGLRSGGQVFSQEVLLTDVIVTKVVARFLGLTERAVDVDQNGKLDRLEITAKLDVVVPGEFEMRLAISGAAAASGTLADVRKTLGAGQQTLTATVPAQQIRSRLSDGPWVIGIPQIFRPEGNTFGEFVAVPQTGLTTRNYKIADW